jgi:transposase
VGERRARPAPPAHPVDPGRRVVRHHRRQLRRPGARPGGLAAQIRQRAQARFALLTALSGESLLTAGALAGIPGRGRRFRTDAQLAAYAGVAPLEASSAGRVRHRLNRGWNRRLNAILHRMAITQARSAPAARAYLARRESEAKTRREALRALKRFLVRAIRRRWEECVSEPSAQPEVSTIAA